MLLLSDWFAHTPTPNLKPGDARLLFARPPRMNAGDTVTVAVESPSNSPADPPGAIRVSPRASRAAITLQQKHPRAPSPRGAYERFSSGLISDAKDTYAHSMAERATALGISGLFSPKSGTTAGYPPQSGTAVLPANHPRVESGGGRGFHCAQGAAP